MARSPAPGNNLMVELDGVNMHDAMVAIAMPRELADDLLGAGLATKAEPSRNVLITTTQVSLAVIGLGADTVSLIIAREVLQSAWHRILAKLIGAPEAQVLEIRLGKGIQVSIDIDNLAGDASSASAAALRATARLFEELATHNRSYDV